MPGYDARGPLGWIHPVLDLLPFPAMIVESGTARVLFANASARLLPFASPDREGGAMGHATDFDGVPIPPDRWPHRRAAGGETLDGSAFTWPSPESRSDFIVSSGAIPSPPGRPPAILLSCLDVTRLRDTEAELRRAVRVRDEFSSFKDPSYAYTENAVVDGVIELSDVLVGPRAVRELTVHKFRGGDYLRGKHEVEITGRGIVVHPRAEIQFDKPPGQAAEQRTRMPFGVAELDRMLFGGLPSGSTAALLGAPGAGKTSLGLSRRPSSSWRRSRRTSCRVAACSSTGSKLHRLISIMKMRESRHGKSIREFRVRSGGRIRGRRGDEGSGRRASTRTPRRGRRSSPDPGSPRTRGDSRVLRACRDRSPINHAAEVT